MVLINDGGPDPESYIEDWLERGAPMSEWGKVKEALAQFVTEYENDRPVEDMGALQEEDFNVLYEASETDEPDIQAIRFAWESLTGLESRNHY